MNRSEEPIDRPSQDPQVPGSGDSSPSRSGASKPQVPSARNGPEGPRAIGGPSAVGSPGGPGLLLAEGLNGLLWAASGFVVLYWLCQTFDVPNTWLLIALWLLSGLVVIWPGSDGLIARYLFGLRRPTMVENQRLAASWYAVAARAGVDSNQYTVWIQDVEAATAGASGGPTASVSRWALYTLPPSHLEAVLAHALAAHLRGRSWLGRLAHWYSVPARILALVIRLLLRLSRTVPAVGCTIIGFLLVAYFGIILVSLVFYDSLAVPLLLLLPLFSPLLFVGAAKLLERMADRATADLGYGRRLLEVLYGWQAQHQAMSRRAGIMQPDWLAGQSSVAERIRAIEVYLQSH